MIRERDITRWCVGGLRCGFGAGSNGAYLRHGGRSRMMSGAACEGRRHRKRHNKGHRTDRDTGPSDHGKPPSQTNRRKSVRKQTVVQQPNRPERAGMRPSDGLSSIMGALIRLAHPYLTILETCKLARGDIAGSAPPLPVLNSTAIGVAGSVLSPQRSALPHAEIALRAAKLGSLRSIAARMRVVEDSSGATSSTVAAPDAERVASRRPRASAGSAPHSTR
jgi:hypothetical protein